jgi:transposase-like protein
LDQIHGSGAGLSASETKALQQRDTPNRCWPIRACLLHLSLFCGRILVYVAQTTGPLACGRRWPCEGEMIQAAASGPMKRVERTAEEKRRIVEVTLVPGASIARVARENGVNANQVFQWRYECRNDTGSAAKQPRVKLLPVTVAPEPNDVTWFRNLHNRLCRSHLPHQSTSSTWSSTGEWGGTPTVILSL